MQFDVSPAPEAEGWTRKECCDLDAKIDRALAQVSSGNVFGPEHARLKLAAIRGAHLAVDGELF